MNDKIREAFIKFMRDVGVAFVAFVIALATIFNIMPQAQEGVIGVQGLQPQRFGNPVTFDQSATFKGAVAATVVNINSTPVYWATAIPTPTPEIYVGNTPAAVKEICKTVNVIGSATVTFPGITTPQAVGPITLNNSGLGNADYGTFVNASGVITIYTYRVVAQTPVAATTVVAVDVCAKGQ